MAETVLGLDVGGTMIKGALLTRDGVLLCKDSVPTQAGAGVDSFVKDIGGLVRSLGGTAAGAAGVGMAGVLDPGRAVMLESPNLPAFNNMPLQHLLQQELGMRVYLENDANCAALGELWAGAGRGIDNFLFFTVGTGIGAGLVLNGSLWKGELGKAGEFGHMTVVQGGNSCACGRKGCLEAYSSGSAIVGMARRAIAGGRHTCLKDDGTLTPETVSRAAAEGDETACFIYRVAAVHLAAAMAAVNSLLDIHVFIIGGGVAAGFVLMGDLLLEETRNRVFTLSRDRIGLHFSELGNDAGVYGAGYLALGSSI